MKDLSVLLLLWLAFAFCFMVFDFASCVERMNDKAFPG